MEDTIIGLEQYKGSFIQKGFEATKTTNKVTFDSIKEQLKNNLQKGLIDEDLFNKAVGELDSLKGGLADKKTPKDIAEKWGVTVEEVNNAIEDGSKIEMEHTKDESEAKEIASDHIYEKGLEYYAKLQEMEEEMGDSNED